MLHNDVTTITSDASQWRHQEDIMFHNVSVFKFFFKVYYIRYFISFSLISEEQQFQGDWNLKEEQI